MFMLIFNDVPVCSKFTGTPLLYSTQELARRAAKHLAVQASRKARFYKVTRVV